MRVIATRMQLIQKKIYVYIYIFSACEITRRVKNIMIYLQSNVQIFGLNMEKEMLRVSSQTELRLYSALCRGRILFCLQTEDEGRSS